MKRILFISLLLLTFILPAAAFAQGTAKVVWDLRATFTVKDLGFTFNYPKGWISDAANGITIAETQDDIDAQNDDKNDTQPEGAVITLTGVPISLLKDQLGDSPTLDDVADYVVKMADVTESEARTEVPVMSRRTITIFGTSNKTDRGGIATLWHQDDFIVLAFLSAPDMPTVINLAYSWGQLLGSITPLNALAFEDKPLTSPNGDFTINYPKGWFTKSSSPTTLTAEDKADLTAATPKGLILAVQQFKLRDLGKDLKDLESLAALFLKSSNLPDTTASSEHLILGEKALAYRFENPQTLGQWVMVTLLVKGDVAVIISAIAPSEDKFTELMPTFIAMLKSIQPVKK